MPLVKVIIETLKYWRWQDHGLAIDVWTGPVLSLRVKLFVLWKV